MVIREFTAIYKKRGKRYLAWIEELPGVNTQGNTKREAEANLREAALLILEANRRIASKGGNSLVRRPLRVSIPALI